jgi:hypothetical protein
MNILHPFLDKLWLHSLLSAILFHQVTSDTTYKPTHSIFSSLFPPIIIFYICRLLIFIQYRPPCWVFEILNGILACQLGHTAAWLHAIISTDRSNIAGEVFLFHTILSHETLLALAWLLPLTDADVESGPRMWLSRPWTLIKATCFFLSLAVVLRFLGEDERHVLTLGVWLQLLGLRKAMYWLFYLEYQIVWFLRK